VLAFYYLLTRRWAMIPLLAVGSLSFNLLGYLYTGRALWIFSDNPYLFKDPTLYGHGSLSHFFVASPHIFGVTCVFFLYATILKTRLIPALLKGAAKDDVGALWVWLLAAGSAPSLLAFDSIAATLFVFLHWLGNAWSRTRPTLGHYFPDRTGSLFGSGAILVLYLVFLMRVWVACHLLKDTS
jgi:hypothetical protein